MTLSKIDPDQFIITRKRKKYRFALFANSDICFEFDDWQPRPIDVVEIGAGTGLFSVELARLAPDKVHLAIDVKGDRLQKGARQAEGLGLTNIYFLRARADQLPQIISPTSLETIWLTFADPFPKKRSSGRRMTHPSFLRLYREALKSSGRLRIKHDNPDFFSWSLEQLVAEGWLIDELTFDLHDSSMPAATKIMTTYEQRWVDEGRLVGYVAARAPGN